MKKEILGKCMLLMSALIWGSSFIVMKNAVDFISPFTLLCIRFVLSTIFISILFFNKIKKIKKQDLLGGFLAGLALFSAFSIQTFGLQLTTPGKNAFLTAVYCTIVPLLSWLYFKKKPDKAQIFAAILCFIGVGFVSLDSSLKVNLGDLYTLIGGFLYAVHIIVCEKAMKKTSPIIITALQFAFASILFSISSGKGAKKSILVRLSMLSTVTTYEDRGSTACSLLNKKPIARIGLAKGDRTTLKNR